jgi:putative ABC transport system permease protein
VTLGSYLRHVWLGIAGARLRHAAFVLVVATGVLGVGFVGALGGAVGRALDAHARALIGGDLAVESREPLPEPARFLPAESALRVVSEHIFPTTVRTPAGDSRLVEAKAIDAGGGDYPLVGALAMEPNVPLKGLIDDASVVVARELAQSLGLGIGDMLAVGQISFRVVGLLDSEPDAQPFSMAFGPRVLMTLGGAQRTGLFGFGSRVRHRTAVVFSPPLPAADLARFAERVSRALPTEDGRVRVQTARDNLPMLRASTERVEHFLNLVALLSLLVASAGLALLVRGYVDDTRIDTAVLRCLGLRARDVLGLVLGRVVLLCALGSLLGVALGATALGLVEPWLARLLPGGAVVGIAPAPLARAAALGLVVPVLVAAPALLSLWSVPPAGVLRSDALPVATPRALRLLGAALVCTAALGAAFILGGSLSYALGFSGAVAGLFGLLSLVLWVLLRAVARLPRERLPPALWHALAALTRPGGEGRRALLPLGVGALVVCSVAVVERTLVDALALAVPRDAPTVFLVDVQPDQWEGVAALARAGGATRLESAPVVMARLSAVAGERVSDILAKRPKDERERTRADWVLTREQRITYAATLPEGSRVVEGTLFGDPARAELSLEQGFARDLGVKLGDTLVLDVQGVPVQLAVTSLRSVEWRSLNVNFFMLAEPGVLDDAPQLRLGALRVPEAREQALQDALAERYPNISMLRVRGLLTRISAAVAEASHGVRLLSACTLLSALAVLAASLSASQLRRRREVALLKVLGHRSSDVLRWHALEYALLGLLAASLGAGAALGLGEAFARRVLQLDGLPSLTPVWVWALITLAATVLAGVVATAGARRAPPAETLRS